MSGKAKTNNPEELRIQLLGEFRISIGDRPIEVAQWRLKKSRSLVKLLALAPGHHLHREQVMELLWPDHDPASAANNLYHTLYVARRILEPSGTHPPSFFQLQDEILSLCPKGPLWIDVEAFQAAVDKAHTSRDPVDYREAIDLYTGDLLPEDLYEDWAGETREMLRQEHLGLLIQLSRLYEERKEYQPAVELSKKVVLIDPLHEEAHLGLMRCYALAGQRQGALKQYQALKETLKRELNAEPDEETTFLYQEILSGKLQPALPAVKTAPLHNLPALLTSFIGREKEIARVKQMLTGSRLVTLTGSGGVGKTRLAMKVAQDLLSEYQHGVWLVELASLVDPELVPQAILRVFDLYESRERSLLQTLLDYLCEKRILLVLDNCEHLIEACARLTDKLLRECSYLRILTTTREALGIGGEVVYHVPSLAAPAPGLRPPVASLSQYDAVRLFIERAQMALPGFQVTDQNAASVAQVCQRLDGIPLALELAAARVKVLSVEQIASRMDDSFRLLTGGSRTALPRHQTLRALIDWSYNLLPQAEQVLFRRLSVFAGGWTLEAAEGVASDNWQDKNGGRAAANADVLITPHSSLIPSDILDLLTQLVNKSLVIADRDQGPETRYHLLATIQQYGQEKLVEAGESAVVRDRHLDFFLQFAEENEPKLKTVEALGSLHSLDDEIDNLREALVWALGQIQNAKAEEGLRLSNALFPYWGIRGLFSEGRSWLKNGVELLQGDDPRSQTLRARAYFGLGRLASSQGDVQGLRNYLAESITLYQSTGDQLGLALAQGFLEFNTVWDEHALRPSVPFGVPSTRSVIEESVAICRQSGDKWTLAQVLSLNGSIAYYQADYSAACAYYAESLALSQELGDRLSISDIYSRQGYIAIAQGEYLTAHSYFQKGLDLAREFNSKYNVYDCLSELGIVAYFSEDYDQMEAYFQDSLAIARDIGNPLSATWSLRCLGIAALDQGDYPKAAAFFLESVSISQKVSDPYGVLACLVGLAGVAVHQDQYAQAARLLGAIEAQFETFFKPLDAWDKNEMDRHNAAARLHLDEATFASAWEEGRGLSLEQAIAEAIALGHEISPHKV